MRQSAYQILDALSGVAYVIDSRFRLAAVGQPKWRDFAVEGGAPGLADGEALYGRNLFDFIAGEEVRDGYRHILDTLSRGHREGIVIPCRCDAPSLTRETLMGITALRSNAKTTGYLFHAMLCDTRSRPPMPLYDFAAARVQAPTDRRPMVSMCSLCERICRGDDCNTSSGGWVEAEAYYAGGGSSHVRISHTICPDCFGRWLASWTGGDHP
jgi:hypothetical protein